MPATTGADGPQRRDPALDGLEVVPGELPPDHELEHRLACSSIRRAHGVVAALQAQVARVEAVGRDGDEGLGGEALLLAERAARGLLAGLIRVEGEDHLAGARACPRCRRRRARGGCTLMWSTPNAVPQVATAVVTPGEVAGHDIRVALDHDDLLAAGDVALGEVEPVEHLALVVDRRLGGVEVLRALVVVEQLARAEADGLPGDVADRPDQPAAEPVVALPRSPVLEQAGGDAARPR